MIHLNSGERLISRRLTRGFQRWRRFLQCFRPLRCLGLALSYLLSGNAEHWWVGASAILTANHEAITWESFHRVFLERYFPVSAQEEKETQFLKLYQGNMTVAEYAAKLESLARHFRFFRGGIDEQYLCARFMNGLKYEIEESVRPLGIQQFQTLVEKCRGVEAMGSKRGTMLTSTVMRNYASIVTSQGNLLEIVGRQELSRQQIWQGEAVQSLRLGCTP